MTPEPLRHDYETTTEADYREGFWAVYDQRVNNREAAHLSGLRYVAAGQLLIAQGVLRGEGEPRHAGESISVNHAEDLLQELRDELYKARS